ncbi:MAG: SUMF1/EgtB/PvdO family nonheme iron enzyme [Deltaproteobacteria bacterium]|nr:SUMF1/EgtB/PvdO family nonheme iron enzyme [Deltaproteobacteria bacterium]
MRRRGLQARLAVLGLGMLAFFVPATQGQERALAVVPNPTYQGLTLYSKSWAVVVGVDKFRNPRVSRLNYAANDARAVARALIQLGFPGQNTSLLLNERATRAEIERVLGSVVRRAASPNDRLVIFFATHGVTTTLPHGGEEGYLLPHDADLDDLPVTALSMQQLKQIGQRIPAKHILVAVDACYGGYSLVRAQAPPVVDRRYLELVGQSRAIQVLTAGRKDQPVIEEQGHGVFTRKLLDGLAGHADGNGDGLVTVSELAAWMHPRVAQASEYKQDMQWGNLDGEGQFVFVLPTVGTPPVPPPVRVESPPPPGPRVTVVPRLGGLQFRSSRENVEVWLNEQRIGEAGPGTDLAVEQLRAGTYRVRVRPRREGFRPWEREVQVVADQKAPVEIDLEALEPPKVITGDDRAEMVLIPAGEFWMGSARQEEVVQECRKWTAHISPRVNCEGFATAEVPRHRVTLSAFYLDRYEVTNAQYGRFREATGREAPAFWSDSRFNAPTQPVVGVSWHDAQAYCRWAGKRLPPEAEWEKAARGTDERQFPWGNAWEPARVNAEGKLGKPAPVGSYPDGVSPYGVHDLAGNVWEWVADWHDATYYPRSPQRNPQGPEQGQQKVLRGGSWLGHPFFLRTTVRSRFAPEGRTQYLGFRCAKGAP